MADVASNPKSRVYTILGLIGEGGFGRVYRARLTEGDFSKDVAIKMLRAENPSTELLARFRDEARILALLRDRAVVSVEPPALLADRWAVVMDFVDGLSLAQILSQIGTVPPAVALEIVAEVARAVDKAYHFPGPDGEPLKLLHRDIKPANIQVTPSGEVRLLDFGTARADFANREAATIQDISGTPGYLAPERLEGTEGPEGDVFSLGVTLWAILTREGPSQRKYNDLKAGITAHSADDPNLAAALELAMRMRDRDPDARPTLAEVKNIASREARTMPGPHLDEWCTQVPPRALKNDDLTGQALTETIQHIPRVDTMSRVVMGTAGVGAGLFATALAAVLAMVVALAVTTLWLRAQDPSAQPTPQVPVEQEPVSEPVSEPVPEAVPEPAAAPPAPSGTPLSFASQPPGATVWVDGSEVGVTPLEHPVPAGEHTVRLQKGLFKAEGVVQVADSPLAFTWVAMQGAEGLTPAFSTGSAIPLTFRSLPEGATLTIDGAVLGATPIEHALSPGTHDLALKKGLFEVKTRIAVGSSEPSSYTWTVMLGDEGLKSE